MTVCNTQASIALLAAAFAAVGCSTQAWPAETHRVEIIGFEFKPASLSIQVGDTVTWINRDIVPHTATASDNSWDTGEIASNQSKSVVITPESGLSYFCGYHLTMKGQLTRIDP